MTKFLLIDVDCGVDDAQAIMMALASPSVEILGITCCYGNTMLENVCKNVLRVLQVCNRLEIPVYQGASAPLLGGPVEGAMYHGRDGLGDVPVPNAPRLDYLQKEHAVIAMLRIVNEKPGQISVVATGPLTNLTLAVKLDPTFPQKLKNMFIMGGNVESRGNVTVCGEFNFVTDPEAAYVVLNEFTCPTYIATWEFTCHNSLSWEFYHEWVNQDTKKAKFMKKISEHSIKFTDLKRENTSNILWTSGFVSCDSYAMAAAIDESFVTEAIETAVSVELNGSLTRGMMVMDMAGLLKKKNKAFVINKCDLEKFKGLLIAALK
ncbi:inosine-uridine preferring nucleoside hydrolase-like [Chelonoidis abingdonii]|uniref:inosine-uridine preferring nucleoside hydrolase-like n=1 Tax=Chelonoidis abingdonii TaxID=106734 RepID=UPI0013F25D3D|nr:inosine-uridine preferring nucleoside hydrolase-like [Chelonoidis abingdonii]XP_032661463.1 inosine-uridine preferring nucleoside hydrolase-like [Chelonoidis abingdonii]XP_032661464.1 inosine-uridine preferring nucleoside hydrolase-like [Chelonoidis abingdonii]XP_032661465.1 inosine-uridine preferring nucleoside hydrolase-like [Chelonoidis abingdonii]